MRPSCAEQFQTDAHALTNLCRTVAGQKYWADTDLQNSYFGQTDALSD